ncbi:MAG: GTP cyclohydrolase I FolE [Pseudomonadota bacterium]
MCPADSSFSAKVVSAVARASDEGSIVKPSRAEAENAVRVLLRWIGEDPSREGLVETPKRVVDSYNEYFGGYALDPAEILSRTFEEVDGYDEMVVLRGIDFQSHCEHHMVPILGKAYVAYLPKSRVVGISKLARVVDAFARRLQIQERLTAQIANTIQEVLQPLGVAIVLVSEHQCMTTRGVSKPDATMATSRMLGAFKDDPALRREFQALAGIG